MKQVYFACHLTGQNDLSGRQLGESICERLGEWGWAVYLPHKHSDPVTRPDLKARDANTRNVRRIAASNLVIAEVTHPSHGVGFEIRVAENYGIPVILLYRRQARVSRQLRGSRTVIAEISYEPGDCDVLFQNLTRVLEDIDPLFLFWQRAGAAGQMLILMIRLIVRMLLGPLARGDFGRP